MIINSKVNHGEVVPVLLFGQVLFVLSGQVDDGESAMVPPEHGASHDQPTPALREQVEKFVRRQSRSDECVELVEIKPTMVWGIRFPHDR